MSAQRSTHGSSNHLPHDKRAGQVQPDGPYLPMIVRVIRPGAVTGLWQLAVPDADLVSVPADLLLPIQEASGRNTEL